MRLSSKGEYGLRALFDLALHYGQGPIQAKDIAKRQDIPELYLHQLLITLRRAKLITSRRGPQGGHSLARPPDQINLAEAVLALEGSTAPTPCVEDNSTRKCPVAEQCALRQIWQQVKRATDTILKNTTLEDLCHIQQELGGRIMYYI